MKEIGFHLFKQPRLPTLHSLANVWTALGFRLFWLPLLLKFLFRGGRKWFKTWRVGGSLLAPCPLRAFNAKTSSLLCKQNRCAGLPAADLLQSPHFLYSLMGSSLSTTKQVLIHSGRTRWDYPSCLLVLTSLSMSSKSHWSKPRLYIFFLQSSPLLPLLALPQGTKPPHSSIYWSVSSWADVPGKQAAKA